MKARTGFFLALLLVAALVCVGGAFWIHRGFRARSTPTASEAYLARKIRNFAIPTSERHSKNPLMRLQRICSKPANSSLSIARPVMGWMAAPVLSWAEICTLAFPICVPR
jgi:hypothetical protein